MPTGVYKRKVTPIKERFERYFSIPYPNVKDCWEWKARISNFGYGQFAIKAGNVKQAHRLSYEIYIGKIPKGKLVCHSCDNRKCVNPKHLWLGTQKDNVRDMWSKNRAKISPGDKNGSAKLNWEKVDNIRKLRRDKLIYYKDLAKMFNVDYSTIKNIINNRSWK